MYRKIMLSALFIFFFFSAVMYAQIPRLLNFQGRLTDNDGKSLTGTYSMTFSIYEASQGGTAIWSETQSVQVQDGLYNVLLGSVRSMDLVFDKAYYLEIKIGNETLPRQPILSSAYSFNSQRLDGKLSQDFALQNHNHASLNNQKLIVQDNGNVGIGTMNPTAILDVAGKIRGKAIYGGSISPYPAPSNSSRYDMYTSAFCNNINVQAGDIVMVLLTVNLRNSSSVQTTYMKAYLSSGAASTILDPNWITVTGSNWVAGTSIGIYKATADGVLKFLGAWHVGGGTGYYVYGNVVAWIIGKE